MASEPPSHSRALPSPDVATCDRCVSELFDPRDRRYRYPFLNCSECGPRFTVTRELPFDRATTTMDAFAMCRACRAEYHDPANRRFHAEPNACTTCGPQLFLMEDGARTKERDAALDRAVFLLGRGSIVGVKGLGGYQLFAAANDEAAIARLRRRKKKPHQPFALLVRDVDAACEFVQMDSEGRAALLSPARPIVLLPRIVPSVMALGIAPGLGELGIMLPSSPVQHLLVAGSLRALAVTSGNGTGEPIHKDDGAAEARLIGIADALLMHDRAIHARADDSIVRIVAGAPQPIRRTRGFVPDAIALPQPSGLTPNDGPSILALGGDADSTVCVTRGRDAVVSAHVGDLQAPGASAFLRETIENTVRLLGVTPAAVAHDLRIDLVSTRHGLDEIDPRLPRVAVQHHHAHVASCLAEHGCVRSVLGVVFDSEGQGPTGERWGGEFLIADLTEFARFGHLRALPVFGGVGITSGLEPWRAGLAALIDAGEDLDVLAYIPHAAADVRETAARFTQPGADNLRVPRSTDAARWLEAFAAIAGIRSVASYDAQASLELDAFATAFRASEALAKPYGYEIDVPQGGPLAVDLRPTVRAVAAAIRDRHPRGAVALGVHHTFAAIAVDVAERARRDHGIDTVALTGSCFASRRLTESTKVQLEQRGFAVLVHRRVPPNDAGVSLGQAAIAAFRLRRAHSSRPPGAG